MRTQPSAQRAERYRLETGPVQTYLSKDKIPRANSIGGAEETRDGEIA
jgi:hypothetical protein